MPEQSKPVKRSRGFRASKMPPSGPTEFTILKQKINGVASVSKLMKAIMVAPGFSSAPEAIESASLKIMADLEDLRQKVQEKLPYDKENPANKAVLSRSLADLLSDAWIATNGNVDTDQLCNLYVNIFDKTESQPENIFENLEEKISNEITFSGGTTNCLQTIIKLRNVDPGKKGIGFLMLGRVQSYDENIGTIKEILRTKTNEIMGRLVSESLPDTQREIVQMSVVKHLSKIFGQALESVVVDFKQELRSLNKEQRQQFKNDMPNHPQGCLIERAAEHLNNLAGHLYPPQTITEPKPDMGTIDEENCMAPTA
jgi:hypothetical protein